VRADARLANRSVYLAAEGFGLALRAAVPCPDSPRVARRVTTSSS
jgi:hypothetical protein